jgi:RNA polymerase sigma factor (sigma-70 family)
VDGGRGSGVELSGRSTASTKRERGPGGAGRSLPLVRRAPAGASWDERCAVLFEDLRKPARVMVARAFGSALGPEEVDDVYANAWASTLAALRGRERGMDDSELRSYVLTAVARHASKEMRRRRRKPTSALEPTHAQVLADFHQPSPEERVVGAEDGSVARDVLSSLPQRRRAVMLLRYGWGLEPKQICSLLTGLSPRAYRKEITRGVGEVIERMRQIESGEWCRSREPLIRDYVAGTADEETGRQAAQHLGHCRSCSALVSRLHEQLHELGGAVAWTVAAGAIGEPSPSPLDRLGGLFDRGREGAQTVADRDAAAELIAGATGGLPGRGVGTAGVGALAKLGGIGAAGKAAVACLGAGAAATACVAAGIVPGAGGGQGPQRPPDAPRAAVASVDRGLAPSPTLEVELVAEPDPVGVVPGKRSEPAVMQPARTEPVEAIAPEGAPAASPAPSAPPAEQEFGLPAAATAEAGTGGGGGGGSGSGGAAGAGDVAREFGP